MLRGPQGTLYGASSLGGLIKFVTRQPDTEHFSGRVEAGLESVEGGASGYVTRGTVNLPLITDKMALLVSGFTRQDPPYIDNVEPGLEGTNINKTRTYGGYASLLMKPIDDLSIKLSFLDQGGLQGALIMRGPVPAQ